MQFFTLAIGVLFCSAGIYLLWTGRAPIAAWGPILFFGGCTAIAVWEIAQPFILRARRLDFINIDRQKRTLVVRSDVVQFTILFVGSSGFAISGLLMILNGVNECVGLFTVAFFGPGALLFLWFAIDPRPRLIIDSAGIIDRTLGIGLISWKDIASATLHSSNEGAFINLILHDSQKYLNRMSWMRRKFANANAAFGFGDVSLNLSGITIDPEEVLTLVSWYILKKEIAHDES